MTQPTDLKDLERKMYRTYYEDGSWDIFIGLLMIWNALFAALFSSIDPEALRYGVMALGFFSLALVPNLLRKFFTAPRLGKVEFSKTRKRRMSKLRVFTIFGVILTAGLVILTAIVVRNPSLSSAPAPGVLIPITVGVFIALIFAGLAYYLDFTRMFFYAAAIGIAITSTMILDTPIAYAVVGIPMVIIGLVYFSRFLKTYPKSGEASINGI